MPEAISSVGSQSSLVIRTATFVRRKWPDEGLLHWDDWLKPGSPKFLLQAQRLRLFLTIHGSSDTTYKAKLPIPTPTLLYADSRNIATLLDVANGLPMPVPRSP